MSSPPALFAPALGLYHLLPLHAPLTLFVVDAPFGRFGSDTSRWKVSGNISWFLMEIVAPIVFLASLMTTRSDLTMTVQARALGAAYVIHYIHRAIFSPLVLSPTRSASNVLVPLTAAVYNTLNAYCLANGLVYYPIHTSSGRFGMCLSGWAVGFLGNIYHDEILNDLRRPPSTRLVIVPSYEEEVDKKQGGDGRYAIPRGGLFDLISFPNYLCEWFEWTCFALAASVTPLIPVPLASTPSLKGLDSIVPLPNHLLHPAWMFVVFEISSMLPRAIRGHGWYKEKFGQRFPKNRKAVIPGLL